MPQTPKITSKIDDDEKTEYKKDDDIDIVCRYGIDVCVCLYMCVCERKR